MSGVIGVHFAVRKKEDQPRSVLDRCNGSDTVARLLSYFSNVAYRRFAREGGGQLRVKLFQITAVEHLQRLALEAVLRNDIWASVKLRQVCRLEMLLEPQTHL